MLSNKAQRRLKVETYHNNFEGGFQCTASFSYS